ncbi:RICIN domain-containing protein [Streptomyces sp. NPDC088812]|uniref:RICIN domain-containing protein n=1 Tax=Streptomyces sp. NPDC088812 TaxID=3365905 RepID=UPI00380CEB04
MRKSSSVLAAVAALGALTAAVPTAHAVDFPSQAHTFRNLSTGTCMGESGKQLRLYDCYGTDPITWQIRETTSGDMFRNTASTSCLDSDGTNVYLSDCNTSDLGQRWYIRDCGAGVFSRLAEERGLGSYLTGWNAGTVSVTDYTGNKSSWHTSGWTCEQG